MDAETKAEMEIQQEVEDITHTRQAIIKKHALHMKRAGTLVSIDKNANFEELMKSNQVVIFPGYSLQAWDKLPRFTILDAALAKYQKSEQQYSRKHKPLKPIFVGSPVRPPEEGGVLSITEEKRQKIASGEEPDIKPKGKTTGDATTCKGSIELYSFMNDVGINRVRDKVIPSTSIALTKAQRTRQLFTMSKDQQEQQNVYKRMHE